jgi:hypothetical protein
MAFRFHALVLQKQLGALYSYALLNDISVNDGPHTRRWSRNIIVLEYNIIIPLCYTAVFGTVT